MTGGKECYVQVKSRTSGVPELPGSSPAPRALSGRLTRKELRKRKSAFPMGHSTVPKELGKGVMEMNRQSSPWVTYLLFLGISTYC